MTVTDEMVEAAWEAWTATQELTSDGAMRAALEAAGVGELVDVLKETLETIEIAQKIKWADWDGYAAPTSSIGRARAVLEKMGVKL